MRHLTLRAQILWPMAVELYGDIMNYRSLGRTGVKVSPLCLGTFNYGTLIETKIANELICAAIDAGINFFDTASSYGKGQSESVLGECLAETKNRERCVITSKCYFSTNDDDINSRGNSLRHIIAECEKSLRRLRTDWIDFYLLHRPDNDVAVDESLRALDDLIRSGKIRYAGTSTFPAWKLLEASWIAKEQKLSPMSVEQPPYNLLDRRIERELIPMAQEKGIGIVTWSPLARGYLTGKYSDKESAQKSGMRLPQGVLNFDKHFTPQAQSVLRVVQELSLAHACSETEIVLSWTMKQPGISSVIFGANKLEHVCTAVKACQIDLSSDDEKKLDMVSPPGRAIVEYYEWHANPLG